MVSPVHGNYRRCQAEIPLIGLCRFPGPALPSLNACGEYGLSPPVPGGFGGGTTLIDASLNSSFRCGNTEFQTLVSASSFVVGGSVFKPDLRLL
jgi:hypothetical protein